MKLNPQVIKRFKKIVNDYYHTFGRDLPWRKTTSAYHVLVSEVMLQQTQVQRVLVKYPEFIARFPDISSLSKSTVKEVLSVWSGMGYNRRALFLRQIAIIVMEQYNGKIPKSPSLLDLLPGIGPATASSICAFAYNRPVVFIETNIRRVFIHHFFKEGIDIEDDDIMALVEKTLDKKNPRDWYYALMDYGSYLGKSVVNPNRRSKHYTIQSSFDGSDRQIRGKILKLLLSHPCSEKELVLLIDASPQRIKAVLNDLIKEGFIKMNGDTFNLH